jgi:general secretion pathway protein B
MSYILDALRRAESERARGQVPGLHDQPALPASTSARRAGPVWILVSALGLALVLAALALWWTRRPAPPAPRAAVVAPAAMVQPVAPVTAPVTAPVAAPVTAAPTGTAAPLLPQVVSAPTPALPASATVAPAAAAPMQQASITRLAELPPDQRREWPNLVLGGSVWSESAANRFVIVNGQLLHEGEAVAPGLIVERIGPKAVVLRWRDRRVEVPL